VPAAQPEAGLAHDHDEWITDHDAAGPVHGMSLLDSNDVSRITEVVRHQFELVRTGDAEAVRDALVAVPGEDLVMVLGVTVVVAAQALEAVKKLGGDQSLAIEHGLEMARAAMATAVLNG
jgi:hypothetical protein